MWDRCWLESQMQQELDELRCFRDMAYRDPLTGLRNRRYLELRVAEELHRVKRKPNGHCSVVMIDLDDLKIINDELGHAEGDSVPEVDRELFDRVNCDSKTFAAGLAAMSLCWSCPIPTHWVADSVDRIWDNLRKANIGREVLFA